MLFRQRRLKHTIGQKLPWGTVTITKNGIEIYSVLPFNNLREKVKMLQQANNIVLNNQNKQVKYQVSLHYGLKPNDLFG